MAAQLALALPVVSAPAPAGPEAPGPAPLVIGLDVALGYTGVAGHGWTDYISTTSRRDETRLLFILDRVQSFYRHAEFVAIEGPAFSRAVQRGHDEMAAIRWMIRCDLLKRGIPCAVIPPNNRIKYALGTTYPRHPATGRKLTPEECKGAVRAATAERYGIDLDGTARYDRADAYVLMAMALDHLGHPQGDLPTSHRDALSGVAWPERTDQ